MGNSCILVPTIKRVLDGKEVPSKLYEDLKNNPNLQGNRALINYIYAQYLSNGGTAMDAAGFTKKDDNGQHLWKDVYTFYNIANIINTIENPIEIEKAKKQAGSIDNHNNIIYYDSGSEALKKAKEFNDTNNVFLAHIVKDGNKYIISVELRNAVTHNLLLKVELKIKLLDFVTHVFNSVNLDLEALSILFPELIDVSNISTSINYLKNLQKTDLKLFSLREIEFLLSTLPISNVKLTRLISKWGDIENVSKIIYNYFRNNTTLTSGELSLVKNTLENAITLNNLNLPKLQWDIELLKDSISKESNYNFEISKVLEELKLDNREEYLIEKKITNLKQAAGKATLLLNKKLKELEKKEGVSERSKKLQLLINNLLKEIDNNRYYSGLILFLEEVTNHINFVENSLHSIEGTPGTLDYIKNSSAVLLESKNIINGYTPLLELLKKSEAFELEEGITRDNLKNISELSEKLYKRLKSLEDIVNTSEKGIVISILSDWLGWGEELPDGRTITNIVKSIEDVSIIEYLYSVCRSSNPMLAALGTIIRSAQDKRNTYITEYNTRIARAQNALKEAGYLDTKWMYDKEGRIINTYDWEKFNEEYIQAKKDLRKKGLRGIDFKIALLEIVNNELTQEIVVDTVSGRTERVPIFEKNNPLEDLSEALKLYYETIMQIKGELGTMLPEYARSHFLPPQVRSNSLWDSKGWKDFFKRIGSNIADKFRITEEDFDLAGNLSFVDTEGESIIIAESDYSNHALKEIPVYHYRKLKDQNKLVTDFSGALQALGASAINYKCLSDIESAALLLTDYMLNLIQYDKDNYGNIKASVVKSWYHTIIEKIEKYAKSSNTIAIAESYLDKELYGERLKTKNPKIAKTCLSLLSYVRFKQLATNILGGVSNLITGEYQIFLEAIGNENFNLKDYAWACAVLFGDNTLHMPGKLFDYLTNNVNEFSTLIGNLFDPLVDNFSELGHKRYNGVLRNLFTYDYDGLTYSVGENLIHYTVMYAMLHNEKVFVDGKETSLYDAFEKGDKIDGSTELKLKENVLLIEINALGEKVPGRKLEDLNDDYITNFRNKIRSANQECHGAMSQEDRGVISQRLIGRAVLQFRQWMIESYSKRYRDTHWDGASKQFTEGWWATATKFLGRELGQLTKWHWKSRLKLSSLNNIINEYQEQLKNRTISDLLFLSLLHLAALAKRQKKNLKAALAEMTMVALLNILSVLLWSEDEDDDEENGTNDVAKRVLLYHTKRLTWDATAISPVGVPSEASAIVTRPPASISYIVTLGYPIMGLNEMDETYEKGINKGKNKYLINCAKLLPLYKDIQKLEKLVDEDHKYWEDLVQPFNYGKKYY